MYRQMSKILYATKSSIQNDPHDQESQENRDRK